ncbi:MAG: glutamine amidotransferase [Planctomycetota bacterium]
MAAMTTAYSLYFAQPWWLLLCLVLVPTIWLAKRSLTSLGPMRRIFAVTLRVLVILILVFLLARPMLTRKSKQLTLIAIVDRSQSIPTVFQDMSLDYLSLALANKIGTDRLAVIDVAEFAGISMLPSTDATIRRRSLTLTGDQTDLAKGIQMAMAIAPPDSAIRILLVTEGNETIGDLKEAARLAAANKIPIDVLPIRYRYNREVMFKRLAAPPRARSNQTIPLRFILSSTAPARGKLMLNLNNVPVDLDPTSADVSVPVDLKPGTNVKTVSVPVGSRGIHEFQALFVPDDPNQDVINKNNRAGALTYVAGPGHILVVDAGDSASLPLVNALKNSNIDVQYLNMKQELFPDNLIGLMNSDAVVLVNTDISNFTFQQQEMICRYVTDLGGGLVMVGGPQSFGAGGWIGSPVADILPVDLDPPQKKQLPKGALVLIMHACEMPQGNFWGKRIAIAAVQTLSRLDQVGVLAYNWQGAGNDWVYPLGPVGDKKAVTDNINKMVMGDMPSLDAHLRSAYSSLIKSDAAQKHVIVISDGDPQPPANQLLNLCRQENITVTGVGIFPHSPADVQSLLRVAQATGGRFYDVKDPRQLPQIFIKEAQVIRRTLIVEETFSPQLTFSLSETVRGLSFPLPNLDGYVLTGPKGGLSQMVLSTNESDPLLATSQAGLGRCVAFMSSADSRWAANWLSWPGFERFWEQTIRWAARPSQSADCEIFADVQGRNVAINIEAVDAEGKFIQFAHIEGQAIAPDASQIEMPLTQTGPGQYRGQFLAPASGSYVINLRYRKLGENASTQLAQSTITIPFAPEFRDLSDNAPLLAQVAEITNGQIRELDLDPNEAYLFDTASVKFPETHLPLTRYLMFAWLVFFLFDVAVRRIAIDFKAIAVKVAAFVHPKRTERKTDTTLDRLKATRKKLREQLSARAADTLAAKRYHADPERTTDLPIAKVEQAKPVEKEAEEQKIKTKKPAPDTGPAHIQQLLKAKQKAAEKRKHGQND